MCSGAQYFLDTSPTLLLVPVGRHCSGTRNAVTPVPESCPGHPPAFLQQGLSRSTKETMPTASKPDGSFHDQRPVHLRMKSADDSVLTGGLRSLEDYCSTARGLNIEPALVLGSEGVRGVVRVRHCHHRPRPHRRRNPIREVHDGDDPFVGSGCSIGGGGRGTGGGRWCGGTPAFGGAAGDGRQRYGPGNGQETVGCSHDDSLRKGCVLHPPCGGPIRKLPHALFVAPARRDCRWGGSLSRCAK